MLLYHGFSIFLSLRVYSKVSIVFTRQITKTRDEKQQHFITSLFSAAENLSQYFVRERNRRQSGAQINPWCADFRRSSASSGLDARRRGLKISIFNPQAVGIWNDASFIFRNWRVSRLFANIFHHLNFRKQSNFNYENNFYLMRKLK